MRYRTGCTALLVGTTLFAFASTMAYKTALAVEVTDLTGLEDIYGRYAPAGDCGRRPQVLVEQGGITIDRTGKPERLPKVEYAAGYNAADYDGIMKVIFPYTNTNGYPVVMFFNWKEQPGALEIQGQDEGWQGGPPLGPDNLALVKGSPYARCK